MLLLLLSDQMASHPERCNVLILKLFKFTVHKLMRIISKNISVHKTILSHLHLCAYSLNCNTINNKDRCNRICWCTKINLKAHISMIWLK